MILPSPSHPAEEAVETVAGEAVAPAEATPPAGAMPPVAAPDAPLLPAILASRCPRCGNAPLFAGWVRFADRCGACALDFTRFNVGDGPAAFLILIVGGLIVALALMLQLSVEPPFWVHILLWVPLTTFLVVYCLRLSKAALLILEYRNQAREGRIAPPGAMPPAGVTPPAGPEA